MRRDGAISQKACDYLVAWAQGTRPRFPRPTSYMFLRHRLVLSEPASGNDALDLRPQVERRPVLVVAAGGDRGRRLPTEPELDDDVDGLDLVISSS